MPLASMTRFMNGISRCLPAIVLFALGLGCGEQTQQAPSVEGPPFFTATIGGVPWSPDDFIAYAGADLVNLQARRHTDDGRDEQFIFYLITSDAFKLTNYRLDGDEPGESSAQFSEFPEVPDPDSLLWFVTSGAHTGMLRITGANTADSVVSGVFAFEAEDRLTHAVRQFRGEFRVRYTASAFQQSR
jgi:hypothetical protein